MIGFKVEGLGPTGGCFEAWALHSGNDTIGRSSHARKIHTVSLRLAV